MTPLAQVDADFDRILGDTWTPATKPESLPTREATPVAQWPTNEGVEL